MPHYPFSTHSFTTQSCPLAFSVSHEAAPPFPHLFLPLLLRSLGYLPYAVVFLFADQCVDCFLALELLLDRSLSSAYSHLSAELRASHNCLPPQFFCLVFSEARSSDTTATGLPSDITRRCSLEYKSYIQFFQNFRAPSHSRDNQTLLHPSSRIPAQL